MTQEHLPVGSSGENRLPAHHDPRTAHQIGQWRGGNALSLDLQDERRDDDEIDLLAYWHILLKRRWLILSILLGVVALALLKTLTTTPMYRATAVLQLEKRGTEVVQVGGMQPDSYGWDPDFLQTQYELIKSRSLAERVASDLDLDQAALDRLSEPGWFGRMLALLRPQSKAESDKKQAAFASASRSGLGVAHFTPFTPGTAHRSAIARVPMASLRR